ncbi:unnamed protein product [Protopolystoma xenopodis]|uniref:Uncharacterized protein n=1 Tax=Protopolystoma xenopodis TaxID=117903 RepID=A0A3S5ATW0_9PLAT|nr:unnamed protein product [Protopolystoma xenopodis]
MNALVQAKIFIFSTLRSPGRNSLWPGASMQATRRPSSVGLGLDNKSIDAHTQTTALLSRRSSVRQKTVAHRRPSAVSLTPFSLRMGNVAQPRMSLAATTTMTPSGVKFDSGRSGYCEIFFCFCHRS